MLNQDKQFILIVFIALGLMVGLMAENVSSALPSHPQLTISHKSNLHPESEPVPRIQQAQRNQPSAPKTSSAEIRRIKRKIKRAGIVPHPAKYWEKLKP